MKDNNTFLYLSEEVMDGLDVSTAEAVECIEQLIVQLDASKAWSAPKSVILTPDGRYMMATNAATDDPQIMAVKSLVLNPRNVENGLPQINGTITLLDSETGLLRAVMDGNWVTAVRTAGLSSIAAKHMARADSSVVTFVGCGVQAHSHLRAFADLFPLREIRAFGRGAQNRDKLCRAAEERGLTAIASASAEEALSGADIVVTSVTFSTGLEPFLDARWLKPGAFACVTDIAAPWMREHFSAFDRIIVDDQAQEAAMPVPMADPDMVTGDLFGLVNGRAIGRSTPEERTGFMFRGLAVGDLALAALAYRKAKQAEKGIVVG